MMGMMMPNPSITTTSVKKRMARFRFLNMGWIILREPFADDCLASTCARACLRKVSVYRSEA
jgi:hypothetical protein